MNINVLVAGTSNQFFIQGSQTKAKFSKKINQLLAKLHSL